MKRAFTLIEMIISISILSIMMIFLYQSYALLNSSNLLLKDELTTIQSQELKKKVLFLDFSMIINNKANIINIDAKNNAIFLQSKNSIHNKINPYITYIVKDSILYRLESFKPFLKPNLRFGNEFVYDSFGEVDSFKIYKSKEKNISFLVNINFKNQNNISMKINSF